MNKKIIIIIICFIASTAKGQEPGIQFTETSGWKEILQKAKTENKYIFLDFHWVIEKFALTNTKPI